MKTKILLILMFAIPAILQAQKNVVPVSQTHMLGISLPEGSKQDKRLLSVAAAGSFLSMSSEYKNIGFSPVEVYSIPVTATGFDAEKLINSLVSGGYTHSPDEGDPKLSWYSRENNDWLVYLSKETKEINLYIGKGKMGQNQLSNSSRQGEQTVANQTQIAGEKSEGSNIPIPPLAERQQDNKELSQQSSSERMESGPHNTSPRAYVFQTTQFDDGWISRAETDRVVVEKGDARVYLCYAVPYNSDHFSGTGVMDRDYYWDNYVAKTFRTSDKQYNDAGEFIGSFQPKYVEGWGIDPVSGQTAFVAMVLTVAPNAAQLTVASYPDEASFRQAFPRANDKFVSDLAQMNRYNKFAVASSDLTGTWQSGGSQMTQWYDAITGAYTGATFASGSATFHFNSGNSYTSIHNGATGAVGAMNSFQQEYKGASTVSNWNIVLTNRREGKTMNFDAHFQAVNGGRLLYLNNRAGEEYLLVRVK